MIIDSNHPDVAKINVYGMNGCKFSHIISVDTDKMEGERYMGIDITGNIIIITVLILKIEGPGIYFFRKLSKRRVINAGKA